MNNRRRLVSVGLVTVCALTLVGPPAGAQEGTLKKIKETGVITLGHRDASIPFSYFDDKQAALGYAIDLCGKIVDAVKAELKMPNLLVKLNPVTSATRIPLMANGTIDLECGSTTNNLEIDGAVGHQRNARRRGDRIQLHQEVGHLQLRLDRVDDLAAEVDRVAEGRLLVVEVRKGDRRVAMAERDHARLLDLLERALLGAGRRPHQREGAHGDEADGDEASAIVHGVVFS